MQRHSRESRRTWSANAATVKSRRIVPTNADRTTNQLQSAARWSARGKELWSVTACEPKPAWAYLHGRGVTAGKSFVCRLKTDCSLTPRGSQTPQTACATPPRAGRPAPTHPSTASGSTTMRRRRRSDPCSDRASRGTPRTRLRRARYRLGLRASRSRACHRGAAARRHDRASS